MIDSHLKGILLKQRGDNRVMAEEILEKLSPRSKERLFRVLQAMQEETESERRKRRHGQFW